MVIAAAGEYYFGLYYCDWMTRNGYLRKIGRLLLMDFIKMTMILLGYNIGFELVQYSIFYLYRKYSLLSF